MQVSTLLADVYDDVVLAIWNSAIEEHSNDQHAGGLSLVAHGGFGRRDFCALLGCRSHDPRDSWE